MTPRPSTEHAPTVQNPSVAIFSSFRKFLVEVAATRTILVGRGIHVSNPPSDMPINPGAEYVRFPGDDPALPDYKIQEQVMARALASTAIYVLCPGGYTGRTASYEIGRAVQAEAPLYFSEMPEEPFMQLPAADRVINPHTLADIVLGNLVTPIR